MGFNIEPTIMNIDFEGTPYDGMLLRMGFCNMAEFDYIQRDTKPRNGSEAAESNERVTALFAKYLIEWNLELKGVPVPCSVEGVRSLESVTFTGLLASWQRAMVRVPNPLLESWKNGDTSTEQSLGMVTESVSPPSWPEQSSS